MKGFWQNQLRITSSQIKIFFGSALTIFLMTCFIRLGITMSISLPKQLLQTNAAWQKVQEKIQIKGQPPTLHEDTSPFIPTTYADSITASAEAYIVVNMQNGTILLSKNSDKRLPVASLTKIMSAMVALDLASVSSEMTVSKQAASEIPTKIGVVKGQQMPLHDLLAAMLLTSANDAAEVVREGVDTKYNEPVFVRAMNEKAVLLGLSDTHFANPQGFDNPVNYSSASDLARLTLYALNNYPEIRTLVGKDYLFVPANTDHKQFDLYNWNGLLDVYPGVYGVKIGNTEKAKTTAIVASQRENVSLLVVVLGAPDIRNRDLTAANLLNAGFAKYRIAPFNVTDAMLTEKYASWKYWQ